MYVREHASQRFLGESQIFFFFIFSLSASCFIIKSNNRHTQILKIKKNITKNTWKITIELLSFSSSRKHHHHHHHHSLHTQSIQRMMDKNTKMFFMNNNIISSIFYNILISIHLFLLSFIRLLISIHFGCHQPRRRSHILVRKLIQLIGPKSIWIR